jgi:polysaccharide pyruvyl transferase WcaK-like protein
MSTQTAMRPLTVGLMWHSAASDNLGVGALTVSQIAIVEAIAAEIGRPVRFVILGWKEASEPYVTGPNIRAGQLRTRDLVSPNGFRAAVRDCDLVLDIGAGDSFSDIYGVKRFLKYIAAKMTVHAAGRPLIVSPQTIGPFKRPWVRRLALASLHRSAAVFARDALSIDFLRSTGFKDPVHLASDVALRLPYTPPAPRAADGPVRVGINVSGLLMNGGYTGANMFGLTVDYPGLMRRIIARFAAESGCEVHLVPHVISERMPVEDDWRASEALAQEIPGRIVLAPKFATPSEAKSYIAGMDFFMGARMHACIAAFSSGVPVIPMAYSRKFAGLFDALGYGYTVDCTKEDAQVIEDKIFAHFGNRAVLKGDLEVALRTGQERLSVYEAELRRQMLMAAR